MDLSDIPLLGKIGIFLLAFIICIGTFSVIIDEFTDMEEYLGLQSHSEEYEELKFSLGFIIILCMAGCALYLFQSKKKKKKEDEDGN